MNQTYSAAQAREEFAQILQLVTVGYHVTINRYGQPVAQVIPVTKVSPHKNSPSAINKYYGIWAKKSWAKTIGKPSRHFRNRS